MSAAPNRDRPSDADIGAAPWTASPHPQAGSGRSGVPEIEGHEIGVEALQCRQRKELGSGAGLVVGDGDDRPRSRMVRTLLVPVPFQHPTAMLRADETTLPDARRQVVDQRIRAGAHRLRVCPKVVLRREDWGRVPTLAPPYARK